MAIAKKPLSNQMLSESKQLTAEQQAFISNSPKQPVQQDPEQDRKKVPVMLRVDPELLKRIDHAAKGIGLKRAAFILSSAVERINRMES